MFFVVLATHDFAEFDGFQVLGDLWNSPASTHLGNLNLFNDSRNYRFARVQDIESFSPARLISKV